jgi:hypothetical protein
MGIELSAVTSVCSQAQYSSFASEHSLNNVICDKLKRVFFMFKLVSYCSGKYFTFIWDLLVYVY